MANDTNTTTLLENIVGYGQQGVFATLFGFFTSAQGKMLLMEHPEAFLHHLPLQVILFPLAAGLELVELGMAIKAVNANDNAGADEYLQLLVTAIKTIAVITAIGIGVSATIAGAAAAPAIVPILFTIALGTNTFNHLARTFYHLGAMHAATDHAAKAVHWEKVQKHLIGTVATAMLLSAIVGLFVLGVSSGVGLAVLSGVGLAAIAMSLILPRVLKSQAQQTDQLDTTKLAQSADDQAAGLPGDPSKHTEAEVPRRSASMPSLSMFRSANREPVEKEATAAGRSLTGSNC
jgi:hypothetical protein